MARALSERKEFKGLTLRVSSELKERIDGVRQEAKRQGKAYKLAPKVERFLLEEVEKAERELREENDTYNSKQGRIEGL